MTYKVYRRKMKRGETRIESIKQNGRELNIQLIYRPLLEVKVVIIKDEIKDISIGIEEKV